MQNVSCSLEYQSLLWQNSWPPHWCLHWQAMLFIHGVTTGWLPWGIWEARAAEGSEPSCGSTTAVCGWRGRAGWGWAAGTTVWSYSRSSCQGGAVWEKAQKLREAATFQICGVNVILKFLSCFINILIFFRMRNSQIYENNTGVYEY